MIYALEGRVVGLEPYILPKYLILFNITFVCSLLYLLCFIDLYFIFSILFYGAGL